MKNIKEIIDQSGIKFGSSEARLSSSSKNHNLNSFKNDF